MYYEVVYEDGSVSIADYASEADAVEAIEAQNERAKDGQPNGPQGGNATRVAKVFKYDNHPGDYGTNDGLAVDEVKAAINDMLQGIDVVNVQQLAQNISALNHPMKPDAGVHESKYKQEPVGELELTL